jgi:anti-anti-sigma regulatory factor
MRRHGPVGSVIGLGVADHLCWSYDDDAELRAGIVRFLADGRDLGLRLLYLADKPPEALRADLAELPDRDELVERGTLSLVSLSDVHDPAVGVAPEERLRRSDAMLGRALADGYAGLRVVVEGTSLVRDPSQRDAVLRWEHLSDRYAARGNPISGLCAYDRRVLGDGAVEDILCAHPLHHRGGEQPPFQLFAEGEHLAMQGEVDVFATELLDRLLEHARCDDASVIDVARLRFIDHHGVLALARHGEAVARDGGVLTLRGASPAVRRVWELLDDAQRPAVQFV